MAKCCITGRKTSFKNIVSRSHHKTKKIVKPNLHRIHVEENGTRKHIVVSARAMKKADYKRV